MIPFGEFVALMATMTALIALSIDMVLPALPAIAATLGVQRANDSQLILSVLFLGFGVGQFFYGPISESVGRKPAVYVGLALFSAGCLLALLARSFPMMLAGRVLQGVGVGGPRAMTIALVRDRFEGRAMARVMSLVMAVFILVPVIAPSIGQAILGFAGWRTIFGIYLALGLMVWVWFAWRQQETLAPERRLPLSIANIGRAAREVVTNRLAVGYTLAAGLVYGAFIGYLSSVQQILQEQYTLGPKFPLYFATLAVALGGASLCNARLVGRYGMRPLAGWALTLVCVVSVVFLAVVASLSGHPPLWALIAYLLASFFGIGLLFGNLNALAMQPLGHIAGIGAAVVGGSQTLISLALGTVIGQSYDNTVLPLVAGFAILSGLAMAVIRFVEARTIAIAAMGIVLVAAAAPAQPPTAPSDAPPRANRSQPATAPLPPLTADAQQLLDRWKQEQANVVDQLRFLQRTYRDEGRAEDAAAIAAHVRTLQQRTQPVARSATADLVNEGLPTRDEPVLMSLFRSRAGATLSFAIRGRDDQQVWGTTTYTDASALETAAVHAGLLRSGQSAIVKVLVLPGQDTYDASTQNGVQSIAYERYAGSYRFVAASVTTPARTPSLSSYRDLLGHAITIPVVGSASGSVWGTDIYTDDSSPAAAAVHAGVLSAGEFGFVKITLMPGQARYDGSARNGVASQPYGGFEGSFRVERDSEPPMVQLPGGEDASPLIPLASLRGRTGSNFVVRVVGASTGPVWGTGAYTDDSSIATAAVHAGLLEPGQLGLVRVTVGGGRDSFDASESHGVKSQPYGPWEGSFRLERVAKP